MAKVKVNDITMNYEQQGTGEPLVLIPYSAADNACYAFQVGDYAKHFTCISIDPRGAGETDKPEGTYSTQQFADDVAALLAALDVERAHVIGLSLGAATGLWLASLVSRTGQIAIAAQLLDQDRPVPDGRSRTGEPWPRVSTASPKWSSRALSLLLHPRALCREARHYRPARRLRAQPAKAAVRRFHAPVGRRHRARRVEPARPDHGAHANHLRRARYLHVDPLRRRAQDRDQGQRARRVRDLRARADEPRASPSSMRRRSAF